MPKTVYLSSLVQLSSLIKTLFNYSIPKSIYDIYRLSPRSMLLIDIFPMIFNFFSYLSNYLNICFSSLPKVKEEKRPWILRAREATVQTDGKIEDKESHSWPQTLIYISCGWESFKRVKFFS